MTTPRWKTALVEGLFPLLETPVIEALHKALTTNDPRLIKHKTVWVDHEDPRGLDEKPPTCACLLGFCCWQEQPEATAQAVLEGFSDLYKRVDARLKIAYPGESNVYDPALPRCLDLTWLWDTHNDAFALIADECEAELARRKEEATQ